MISLLSIEDFYANYYAYLYIIMIIAKKISNKLIQSISIQEMIKLFYRVFINYYLILVSNLLIYDFIVSGCSSNPIIRGSTWSADLSPFLLNLPVHDAQ